MKCTRDGYLFKYRFILSAGFLLSVILGAVDGPSAFGQVYVAGRVVDPANNGVPNVNIDFFDSATGDPVAISNDGTNSNGDFNVYTPTGIFDMWFYPPSGSGLAPAYLMDVTVAGNLNLGDIQVEYGYLVSGTIQDTQGVGIEDVKIDVTMLSTGATMILQGDQTGSSGEWSFVLAKDIYDFEFDPTKIHGSAYAPGQLLDVVINSAVNLGTLVLPPGNVLSGYVHAPGGSPVSGADTDVRDIYSGDKLFTPDDNTDPSGFFSVVVPAGTWDVEIDPPKPTKLVAEIVPQVIVNGQTSIGTVTVQAGHFLQGTVTGPGGAPLEGVDIDVVIDGWKEVLTPGDGTDSAGYYTVVVPAGKFLVEFIPVPGSGLEEAAFFPVTVSGDTVFNAVLEAASVPPPSKYGTGLAGTGGFVPAVGHAGGYPFIGNKIFGVTVTMGLGSAQGHFIYGLNSISIPYLGGTVLARPTWRFPVILGGTPGFPGGGGFVYPLAIPNNPAYVNKKVYFQYVVADPGAAQGYAFSDGLEITISQ